MARPIKTQVNLVDLARRLKLSPGAVSHALNGTTSTIRVSPETVKRVRAMATKLGYRPNRVARMLRTGRSNMVGILAKQGFSPLHPQLLYYARENAERIGLVPFIYETTNRSEEAVNVAMDFMLDAKVDALFVLGGAPKQLTRMIGAGIPIASVGKLAKRVVPSYWVDQEGGYRMVAQHLVEQGYSKLALVTDSQDAPLKGVESALKAASANGKKVSLSLHMAEVSYHGFMAEGVPHMHGIYAQGYLAMKKILDSGKLPDAVIFRIDSWVQGGLRACKEAGLRVPEDIAVAGFGDEPTSSAGILSLTTVVQPLAELTEAAFTDFQTVLQGKKIPASTFREFPCRLVVRESTQISSRRSSSERPAAKI